MLISTANRANAADGLMSTEEEPVVKEENSDKLGRTPPPESIVSRSAGETLEEKLDSLIVEEEVHRPNRVPFRKPQPTHVVTIRLTEGDFEELAELKTITGERTLSGVVLSALATYVFLVEQLGKGREIWVVEPSNPNATT